MKIEGFNATPEAATVSSAPVSSAPASSAPVSSASASSTPVSSVASPAVSYARPSGATTTLPRQENPRRTAPPSSFKLKEAIAEIPVPDAPRDAVETPVVDLSGDAPFNLAAVSAALTRFVPADGGVAMHAALTAYPPTLDETTITLKLDNALLLTKAKDICPSLLAFLKQELNNRSITVQLELYDAEQDTTPVKRLYTAKDKFDHFLAMNPAVRELQDRFLLELP